MSNLKKNSLFKGIVALILVVYLLVASSGQLIVYAADMPSAGDLKQSITDQAASKTSAINADTSAATQTTVTPPVAQTNLINSGNNTNDNNSSNSNNQTGVDNQNNTSVNQNVNADANTGNNTANGNISIGGSGAGIIMTGDATVNTTGTVNGGTNTTAIGGSSSDGGAGSNVLNSGNGLSTTTSSNATSYTAVNNGNTTIINQGANVSANTGGNHADGNIAIGGGPSGLILTGNASTSTSFLVTGGGNVTLIGGNGTNGPGDGASIILANSGNNSHFSTQSNSAHYTIVTNSNRAILSQTCGYPIGKDQLLVDMGSCMANTGGNTANGNIGIGHDAGVIVTGDARVDVNMTADANHNNTVISGGGNTSGANSDIVNSGNNVGVNSNANSSNSIGVNNNNNATVNQTVNARANTGNNTANGNISFGGVAGFIKTGNATVNVSMTANLNSNNTTINSGSGDSATAQTNIITTGNNLNDNTNSNTVNNTSVNNNNNLSVWQLIVSFVNTGLNSALGNIGAATGIIHTGNANSKSNTGVVGNTNCTWIGQVTNTCLTPTPAKTSQLPQATQTSVSDPQEPISIGGSTINIPYPLDPSDPITFLAEISAAIRSNGSVKGAQLPATGADQTLVILLTAGLMFVYGVRLRKQTNRISA